MKKDKVLILGRGSFLRKRLKTKLNRLRQFYENVN